MTRSPAIALALSLIAACAEAPPADPAPGAQVEVAVAALNLPGVGDVVWDLEVRNPTATVWQRRITSSTHGDSAGSASYVGPCDADANPNTVRVWVVGVYAGDVSAAAAGPFASGSAAGIAATALDFQNPTAAAPLTQTVTCSPNADAAVQFDATLMRPATQGFFDVAVSFSDIFCSAKFDCCAPGADATCASDGTEDLRLLFDASGARARTLVLGFACTAGPSAGATELYLDPLALDCTSPTAPFAADFTLDVDPDALGNQCTPGPDGLSACAPRVTTLAAADPDDFLFQFAVYRGTEALTSGGAPAEKRYWNVALGVKPAITSCRLRTRGTAEDPTSADDHVVDGTIAAGTVYPFVQWDLDLDDCAAEPLTFGDPSASVRTDYTATADASTTFVYTWAPGLLPDYRCAPACAHGACSGHGLCTCDAGWTGAACDTPVCATPCGPNRACTAPDTCTCTPDWSGPACDVPVCDPACLSGYACTAPNTCTLTAPQPCTGVGCNIFSHTGADQSFVVPAGVTTLTAKLWAGGGAGGGLPMDSPALYPVGGGGGFATGTFAVTPGETLTIIVGGGGQYAPNTYAYGGGGGSSQHGGTITGGGGGRSAIRRGATELLTAGGGGGAGGEHGQNDGGPGGGASGGPSTGYCVAGGGTQSEGGARATCNYNSGNTAGSAFQGGTDPYCGGGGGGGWFGGGSGNHWTPSFACGGGGGGAGHLGSGVAGSLVAAAGAAPAAQGDVDYAAGVAAGGAFNGHGGHGRVVLDY